MWKCTGCDWTGNDLVPVFISAGIQGQVKTFACPECGKTVGGGVMLYEPPKEVVEEIPKTEIPKTEWEFTCQYCGKECKSMIGLMSHERACSTNPNNT